VIQKVCEFSNKTIIDVKKCHIKRFQMVEQFLGKTASPSKCPPDPMPRPAIVPFYPRRALFPCLMRVIREHRYETVPIIRRYPVITYPQPFYPLPQFLRRL
jgi:hypothetical protein